MAFVLTHDRVNMPLTRLLYASAAVEEYDSDAIQSILQTSRRNNRQADVTGCLLFSGKYFAQVLEGRSDVLGRLVKRISSDTRHGAFRVLQEEVVTERSYSNWDMGYLHDLTLEDDIEALVRSDAVTPTLVQLVADRMRPDVVTGALR